MAFEVPLRIFLLAQEGGGQVLPPSWMGVLPFLVIGLLFYFMLIRPERGKQQSHRQMLANLKKSDRVVTLGGIKGIVANVNREAEEVTLTVDESTGTKLRVSIASIARVELPEAKKNKS